MFFHIGLHKTATTALQKQLFPRVKGLRFLDRNAAVDRLVQAATTQDPIYFDPDLHRSAILPILDAPEPSLVSKEALSGGLYAGLGKRGLDHRSDILRNLSATFPDSRIILVLRRQDTLAISVYRQYLKVGGTHTIEDFYGLSTRPAIFPLDRFKYYRYVECIDSLFPALILTFEEFCRQRSSFLSKLAEFIGLEMPDMAFHRTNARRLGSTGLEVTRIVNRFCRSRLEPYGLLPAVIPTIQDRWPIGGRVGTGSRIQRVANQILESVKDDNRQLESTYSLGLEEEGYF